MKSSRFLTGLIIIVMLFGSYGCAVLVAGAVGAGAAYSLTADTVSGNLDAPKSRAYNTFKQIITEEGGKIISSSYADGSIKAKLNDRTVYFSVEKLTEKAIHIKIRARKGYQLLPDGQEALRLYKKLTSRL